MKNQFNTSDPDIRGSLPALRRAARQARKLSLETNTAFLVMRKGKIVDLNSKARGSRRKKN